MYEDPEETSAALCRGDPCHDEVGVSRVSVRSVGARRGLFLQFQRKNKQGRGGMTKELSEAEGNSKGLPANQNLETQSMNHLGS